MNLSETIIKAKKNGRAFKRAVWGKKRIIIGWEKLWIADWDWPKAVFSEPKQWTPTFEDLIHTEWCLCRP